MKKKLLIGLALLVVAVVLIMFVDTKPSSSSDGVRQPPNEYQPTDDFGQKGLKY